MLRTVYLIVSYSIAIHAAVIGAKITVSLYALQLGTSPFMIGVLAALFALAPLTLGILAGRLADTRGTRWPMIGGGAVMCAGMLAPIFVSGLPGLILTAVLAGGGFMVFNVCVQTVSGGLGKREHRARNFAILSVGYSISTFMGPVSAGLAIDHLGHRSAFVMLALFTLMPVAGLLASRRYERIGDKTPDRVRTRSAVDLLRLPPVRSIVIISGLVAAGWDLFAFYLPVYAHAFDFSATQIGMVLGAYAAAAFITRFAMPALLKRWRAEQVMCACIAFAAVAFAAFPLWANYYYMLLVAFCLGLGLGCGQPLSMMIGFNRAPEGRAGEVTGLRLSANNVVRVVIPIVCGALGSAFGAVPVFLLNALNLGIISYTMSRQ